MIFDVPSARFWLALIACGVCACAQDVGDIDRTQPNLLPKSMFEDHRWFVRQTVTDVPATSAFSFVGETGTTEIIKWEIQQDTLVGYRAYERVPGANRTAQPEASATDPAASAPDGAAAASAAFRGNPIVAYPILDQVDVIRDYNPRTGEQTNVIREDSEDRPWYDRAYIRVDWSQNLVANFEFISTPAYVAPSQGGYVEESEGGPDAFTKHQTEDGDVDYFDFTERLFVQPAVQGCILSRNYRLGDCTSDEIKVRTSFMRVDEARERDYVPMAYDDLRQGEFGYFRVERPTYDPRRGVTWSGVEQLITRHDLWELSRDPAGQPRSFAQRGLRPVVYALNADYPEELKPVTRELVSEWDALFKESVAAARGQTEAELERDLNEQTGADCLFCLDENADGHARIGDLRYNFLYWVDHPQQAGPLGYGPSSPNPETGRILAGMAYVYGASVDTQAQDAKDIVDLLNGDLNEADFFAPEFARREVLERKPLSSYAAQALFETPLATEPGGLFSPAQKARLEAVRQNGLPTARPGQAAARLERIRGTALERALIDEEVVLGRGQGQYLPTDPLSDEAVESLSPLSWATVEARKEAAQRQDRAARSTVWLREFSEPSVIGLAKAMKDRGLSGDALWQALREQIFRAVMLHEVGHTVGLRHNFGASADALNYFSDYWALREQTISDTDPDSLGELLRAVCEIEDADNAEACAAQRDGRMTEYQYSSVMDYGAKFNSDIHGLGHYDRAALAAGYADLVEVFSEEAVEALSDQALQQLGYASRVRVPTAGALTELVHYSRLPAMFGGSEGMEKRRFVLRSHYDAALSRGDAPLRVPYIACYDEYVDATPYCHRWDAGADPYEITMRHVSNYREYYPLMNLARDRVDFSSAAVGDRLTSRVFLPIANMYQQWFFSAFGGGSGDPLLISYFDMAAKRGFSLLWQVMSTPRYGSYQLTDEPGGGSYYAFRSYRQLDDYFYVPPGVGRRAQSRYDSSAGFNFYQRVAEVGYFYEQVGALAALTANDASVLGIGADLDADSIAYSIPYYLYFQEEIDALFAGILTQDFDSYGPYVVDGEVVQRDLWREQFEPVPEDAVPLQVGAGWTTRLYTMLYGAAFLSSNFDTSFLNKLQVAVVGESETITPGAGYEEIRATDPLSGRTYAAYRDPQAEPAPFVAAKIVERLARNAAEYAALPEDSPQIESAKAVLQNDVETLEMMRSLYATFNWVL